MNYIYKLTSPEGKIYIGRTTKDKLYQRCLYGVGYSHNKELTDDIVKFGWNNFKHEVIAEIEDTDAAFIERQYILKYKSHIPTIGYNKYTNKTSTRFMYGVRCVETGEVFKKQIDVARKLGVSRQAISTAVVNGTTCGGYHWERFENHKKIS